MILCAAIWVDDGKHHAHQPVETGLVFCGYRHCNIIPQIHIAGFLPQDSFPKIQGFLTKDGKFVNRKDAANLAFTAGQISEEKNELFSEDLY